MLKTIRVNARLNKVRIVLSKKLEVLRHHKKDNIMNSPIAKAYAKIGRVTWLIAKNYAIIEWFTLKKVNILLVCIGILNVMWINTKHKSICNNIRIN